MNETIESNPHRRFGAIVLAAGASRRMGSNKALLPINGKPMLLGIVESIISVMPQIEPIIVVTGHAREAIEKILDPTCARVRFAHNPNYDSGEMLSSVKVGLRALQDQCDAAFIVLGDQPFVRSRTIESLAQSMRTGVDVARPMHRQRHGHPILLAMKRADAILDLPTTATLKDFVGDPNIRVFNVEVDDVATITDIDTPGDYQAICEPRE